MNFAKISVLLLPIITGLNGLIWARLVDRPSGPILSLIASTISHLVLIAYLLIAAGPPQIKTSVLPMGFLIAANTVVSILWLYPYVSGVQYSSLALIEGAWPIFSILFTFILFKNFELDLLSSLGGALIIIGGLMVGSRI